MTTPNTSRARHANGREGSEPGIKGTAKGELEWHVAAHPDRQWPSAPQRLCYAHECRNAQLCKFPKEGTHFNFYMRSSNFEMLGWTKYICGLIGSNLWCRCLTWTDVGSASHGYKTDKWVWPDLAVSGCTNPGRILFFKCTSPLVMASEMSGFANYCCRLV